VAEAEDVAAALGHRFSDHDLLIEALTHRSLPPEDESAVSNERLEFLGDAVLGLLVASELYRGWDLAEGEMSKVRAAVVNEVTLAGVAQSLGVGAALRLGRGEDASGGREKLPLLADAMEALIGAIYVDGGLDAAREVVLSHWSDVIADRTEAPGQRDYKTRLQEELARSGATPEYRVVGSGPDHRRMFTATVAVDGRTLGRGTGSSKKQAQQSAARRALGAIAADA
jgi:ribonuclease-3